MGTYNETFKTSDTRTYAESDKPVPIHSITIRCNACKSSNLICIHNESFGSIIGYYREEEYKCLDCGKYTVYELEYDS